MPQNHKKYSNPDAIYTAESVMRYVGLTKNQYNYRRNLIDSDRKKNQKFTEGDIWVYSLVSRYIRGRINASWLAKENWSTIFEACNLVHPDHLKEWMFVFMADEKKIVIVTPKDEIPEGEEFYDKLSVRMSEVMNLTDKAFTEARRLKGSRKTGDEFLLARLKRDLEKSTA